MTERTLILFKPELVRSCYKIDIQNIWPRKGYRIGRSAKFDANKIRDVLAEHYIEHKGKPFYEPLIDRMCKEGNEIIAYEMIGPGVVAWSRKMIGATDPLQAEPWTIRGMYALQKEENMVHASDSVESAERELALWFS